MKLGSGAGLSRALGTISVFVRSDLGFFLTGIGSGSSILSVENRSDFLRFERGVRFFHACRIRVNLLLEVRILFRFLLEGRIRIRILHEGRIRVW